MDTGPAAEATWLIVIVNTALVGAALAGAGRLFGRRRLTEGLPDTWQNAGESVLDFFVNKAREMAPSGQRERAVRVIAPVLAMFFIFIFASNLVMVLPIPRLNAPPTSHFSVTLALALCSVFGTMAIGALFRGPLGAMKHLFWPNPLQWISEITDVMSLSLRLFGNIAGEYMTVVLVTGSVVFGIPLILHMLGLIPAFVQALVFTLLTASFLASAVHSESEGDRPRVIDRAEPGAGATPDMERGA
ncbi:MAG: FoF1 ATP synthase subunit a [Coriobacteriia bacterium]